MRVHIDTHVHIHILIFVSLLNVVSRSLVLLRTLRVLVRCNNTRRNESRSAPMTQSAISVLCIWTKEALGQHSAFDDGVSRKMSSICSTIPTCNIMNNNATTSGEKHITTGIQVLTHNRCLAKSRPYTSHSASKMSTPTRSHIKMTSRHHVWLGSTVSASAPQRNLEWSDSYTGTLDKGGRDHRSIFARRVLRIVRYR